MRVMVKLVFSAKISSNALRSYPMLPGRRRWMLFLDYADIGIT